MFNENGVQVSASTVHAIQAQRDDRAMGRPNARAIRPLPKWAQFRAVGKRGDLVGATSLNDGILSRICTGVQKSSRYCSALYNSNRRRPARNAFSGNRMTPLETLSVPRGPVVGNKLPD